MNWAAVLDWASPIAVAAVISAVIAWPKSKGEGKKAEGEGRQADAGATLQLTEAQIKAQENALRSAEAAVKSAEAGTARAETMCKRCEDRLEVMEKNFKRFIGIIDDEVVAELPTPEKRARVRSAIREAWEGM